MTDKEQLEAIRKVLENYRDAPYHDPLDVLAIAEATIDRIKTILQIPIDTVSWEEVKKELDL